jgi:hypothetical protein
MYIAVLVRRLREGTTYEDFHDGRHALYEQLDEFDFSTDETVAAGRP